MKILIAVDGSSCSDGAVNAVAARPWPAGTEVRIISAVDVHVPPPPGGFLVPDSHYLKLLGEHQRISRDAVEKAESILLGSNAGRPSPLKVETEIINGMAKDVILHVAEEWAADMIVLGSHGYQGLKRLWLGSVSAAVAAHAPCSVEIVRAPAVNDAH
ncbi:MAG: universal stress protein [Blastocatellia bacterium]|nr:universal stress protein [Blastocatellia bacterium]